ncbi:MAG: Asp-tRNA(Asn)/Glu-tRNA(Gln) amidotransferase subunit GatA [Planctomycetota bacterium]
MTSARTIQTIVNEQHAGTSTACDEVERSLQHIDRVNADVQAFREVYADEARQAAERIDADRAAGHSPGALAGVPIAIKDNIVSRHGTSTASSRMLEGYVSPFDATVVQRLEAAGAIIIGRTHCDEFAMGSSGEHGAFGRARNPWNTEHVPGGSSSGSAAAVASGCVSAALGSDTGGSIRQPAAFCGIVGFKPSYGRVSRSGLVAFGSSLDQIGPMTASVDDAAQLYAVIAGVDPDDATTAAHDVEDVTSAATLPTQLRVGMSSAHLDAITDNDVRRTVDAARDRMAEAGASFVDVTLPPPDISIATYYLIATAEASSNLARYDGIRYGRRAALTDDASLEALYAASRSEGFGDEVRRRILVGTFVLSAGYADQYYGKALKARRWIAACYERAFSSCDVILGPTTPTPAFRFGERPDPVEMYQCDVFTVDANIAGLCAMSVPMGVHENANLPVGVQLTAAPFAEPTLFAAARVLTANEPVSLP